MNEDERGLRKRTARSEADGDGRVPTKTKTPQHNVGKNARTLGKTKTLHFLLGSTFRFCHPWPGSDTWKLNARLASM